MINLGNPNIELGISGYGKLLSFGRSNPLIASIEAVLTRPTHTLHDLGRSRIKGQRCRKYDASRFFGAVSKGKCMTDALAVKKTLATGLRVMLVKSMI